MIRIPRLIEAISDMVLISLQKNYLDRDGSKRKASNMNIEKKNLSHFEISQYFRLERLLKLDEGSGLRHTFYASSE